MRTDLTTDFITAMEAAGRSPRLLAVFHFASGDVFVSDQALGAADGLTDEYGALVEDWGDLADVGDPKDPYSSDVRQMTITLWDGGDSPFSDNFLSQDPENVEVDVYQWFAGLTEADKALVDRFVCQDPIETDETSRLLRIDLVSLPMRYDGPLGDVITRAAWANAPDESIGQYLPVVLGNAGYVTTICVRTAPVATLNGSILDDTLSVAANEDLDGEGFAQTGTIQIGSERMTYTSRTDSAFTIGQRGADGTTAAEHLDREEIQQHVTDFTYVVAGHAVQSIASVRVAGFAAPAAIYTVYPNLNPARIVFSQRPYALSYSQGSTFLEMQFDATAAANSALYPHYAYDAAALTSAAEISETYPLLALTQVTANPDRGEIVRCYLGVEWFAGSAAIQHDRVLVSIVGVGDLGYLERPSEVDSLSIDAEVDLDHGHSHSISGEHAHTFYDPSFATQESPHTHTTNLSQQVRIHAPSQLSLKLDGVASVSTSIAGVASYSGAVLHFTCPYGCGFRYDGGPSQYQSGGTGEGFVAITPNVGTFTLYFKWIGQPLPTVTQTIYDIWVDYTVSTTINQAYTGVGVVKQSSGSNAQDSDKATTDVTDLSTDNRSVVLNDASMTTRSVVELFDLTSTVNFDWGWFTGREVRVQYEGGVDDETVYVLHVFFDIEYRKVEQVFSDDVTCEVVGLVDDADGTYSGSSNAPITRPDHVRKWLLMARGKLSADYIDAASFATAGARYTTEGYTFDGVLQGSETVRAAEKQLARECRSRWFWDAGKAMMAFREYQADWTYDETWTQASAPIRMRGLRKSRKRIQDLLNRVHVYYYRDWASGASGIEAYSSMATAQDNVSISAHGLRERPDEFMFDCVRSVTMADDLAAFYLEDGAPSSFYTLEAFLPAFDLQKEDHIRLTHAFTTLYAAGMRVAGIERVFGSGKVKRGNLLRLICETWYKIMAIARDDQVVVGELLNIDMGFDLDIFETVRLREVLSAQFLYTDTISVAEALAVVLTWAVTQTEAITCTESLVARMQVVLGDTVRAAEFLDSAIGAGFGLGGFGDVPFGSLTAMDHNPDELIRALDEIVATIGAALTETITCSDSLLFGSGFGSPWADGDGFGEVPLGT